MCPWLLSRHMGSRYISLILLLSPYSDNANGVVAISSQHRFAGMPIPPGSLDGVFYFSYNAGPVHVVTLSSFYPSGFSESSAQSVWLASDLAAVDRTAYPWVIVTLHAPWCVVVVLCR